MTATSQNGFPVLFNSSETQKWIIPGTDRHFLLRGGNCGYVLACFALWWHRHIEPIDVGIWDEWGWAVRPIRGQTSGYSNHASGTAVDINATRHLLGVVGTIVKLNLLRTRVTLRFHGVIRCGAFYAGRKDEMHSEIDRGAAAVARLALRLVRTPLGQQVAEANSHYVPPIVFDPGTRSLSIGDRGRDVRYVQKAVGLDGADIDGDYGEQTARMVKQWKRTQPRAAHLVVTGRFGRRAWAALGISPRYR